MAQRGYCGIGIYNPKKDLNVGGLYRHAFVFGAAFAFTIGGRYGKHAADTVAAGRHLPVYEHADWEHFLSCLPVDAILCGIEIMPGAESLLEFEHPERAVYLLGAEDTGLGDEQLAACEHVVQIETRFSMNVASTAAVVLYDRDAKAKRR